MIKMLLATVAIAFVAVPSFAQQTTSKDQLVGTWKVVTLKATSAGKVTHPLGDQVAGYVSITPSRIWLLFVDSTRKPPAAPSLTDPEAIAR
jgi:Lipocalin-like domain